MKIHNLALACLLLITLASCKKTPEETNTPSLSLQYTGSTEALTEGREILATKKTGDYICFVGGKLYSLSGNTVDENYVQSASIDVLNVKTGNWQRFNISPQRRAIGVTAIGNKLVVAGGVVGTAQSDVVNIYDLAAGTETTHKLSQARSNAAVAGSGDKIIIAGGYTVTGYSKIVDIYDTKTAQWSTAQLSQERSYIAGTSIGNKIIFAGGVNANHTDIADIYDIQTGNWSTTTISNPQILHTTVTGGNKAFFTGGVNNNNTVYGTETVDIYDAASGTWSLLTLTGNTTRIRACANDEYAFFTYGANKNNYAEILYIYNIKTGKVINKQLPFGIKDFAMDVLGNKVIMAGGNRSTNAVNNGFEGTSNIILYDVKTNSFDTTTFTLPAKVTKAVAITHGNKMLVAGGLTFSTAPPAFFLRKTVSVFELK